MSRSLSRWRCRSIQLVIWCILCVLILVLIALRESISLFVPDMRFRKLRLCPPMATESDGCLTWKPMDISVKRCRCARKTVALQDTCSDHMYLEVINGYSSYIQNFYGNSTCSEEATLRGPRQHVLSYGAKELTQDTFRVLNITLDLIERSYKGWVVRFYTTIPAPSKSLMCTLMCTHSHLDICDVTLIPKPLGPLNDTGWPGWQWAVLGDPLVAAWETRELGQAIFSRESHATTQFINSEKCWHLMRDHTSQYRVLGSGLVGGKSSWGLIGLKAIRKKIIHSLHQPEVHMYIIEQELAPVLKNTAMVHDSVSCWSQRGSVPFPTKRRPGTWVGMPLVNYTGMNAHPEKKNWTLSSEQSINPQLGIPICPYKCRPHLQPNWLYC